MGSVSLKIGDGTARFRRAAACSSAVHLVMLASVLTTNLFALYAFTYSPSGAGTSNINNNNNNNISLISDHVSVILREIEASERKLHQIERELAGYESIDPASPHLPPELRLFLSRHRLPLGPDSRSGITELVSSVAHSCSRSPDLLARYMSYSPFSHCPNSNPIELIAKGCEPLPRRRCLSRSPTTPPPPSLPPLDPLMWLKPRGKNDFSIDDVLALAKGIRIGFDIAGGGDFAARMADRNVTVVTTTSDIIAGRGVFPLLLTPAHRFPFHDSIFDLVHTMRGLDHGGIPGQAPAPPEALEFLMFDIDRVLRTGGIFWLDNYLCIDDDRKRTITGLFERFGYKKLKWVVGEKAGAGKPQVYLSAVLQKPARE